MTRSIPLDAAIAEAEKSGFLSIEDLQRLSQPQATAPAGEGMVTEAPVVGDRKRIDDALVSCAGLLRTLCHDEIGDTATAELEYVRSCIIPAAAPAPGVVWQATEATDAMWEAARGRNSFAASYRAMIAAAPASPQPANPEQVTDAIRGIVEDALNSAIPEPWEVAEHATQRILAAIGAGGQAVADEDALETVERELIDGLEVEINIGAENYTFNHRQLARRILSALSQPHPADDRVVEVLREARELLAGPLVGVEWKRACHSFVAKADAALSATEGRKNG